MPIFFKEKTNNYLLFIILFSFLIRLFFIGITNLLTEEAYYWNYAQHLDFGYLDHPPMVALLIKLSTQLWGTNEFGVRFLTLICWIMTAFYSFQLTEVIRKGSGLYAVMLLAILPFFFMYSLIITPDVPLLTCWAAALYYLYQALCLKKAKAWYAAGLAIGLGMLSKYSICLLIPATLLYLIQSKQIKFWLSRKEPYLAAMIALLLFTPVIYWNAIHHWVSFAFQSTRRMHSEFYFSLHELMALLGVFLTPLGIWGFYDLLKKDSLCSSSTIQFIQIYALAPMAVFGFFSLTHGIKINWIGPSLLAVIPWLALWMDSKKSLFKHWISTSVILFTVYIGMLCCLSLGVSQFVSRNVLNKYIAWDAFTQECFAIAKHLEHQGNKPLFMPLDSYSIASELAFYQAKQHSSKLYPVIGAKRFGYHSLMYDYWSKNENLAGKYGILISPLPEMLDSTQMPINTTLVTPTTRILAFSQGRKQEVKPYYYAVVRFDR